MGRKGALLIQPNERFGNWLTLKFYSFKEVPQTYDSAKWECICDCGFKKFIRTADLLGGYTSKCIKCSCKINTQGNILPEKGAAWNKIFGIIKRSAKIRNLEFSLTKEHIKELVLQNCFYCDCEPSNLVKSSKGDEIAYNGIDRVDNKIGYLKENCVTCCRKCNFLKTDYNLKEMLNQIEKIYKNKEKILKRSETISKESTFK